MPWLLDTNVLSELRRPKPDENVRTFILNCPLDQLYVSSVTMAEIRFGIEVLQDPGHRSLLTRWLTTTIRPMFAGRALPITEDIMLRWRLLVEDGRKAGKTFSQPDLIIAATAIEHELIFVTRNVKDFTGLPLTIVDPWRGHA